MPKQQTENNKVVMTSPLRKGPASPDDVSTASLISASEHYIGESLIQVGVITTYKLIANSSLLSVPREKCFGSL